MRKPAVKTALVLICALAANAGGIARADVLSIGDDGAVTIYSAPMVFTTDGAQPIAPPRRAATPAAPEAVRTALAEAAAAGRPTSSARAVQRRKNIVVAGGTSTGKTTFLNALLKEIPRRERLILIEDAPEVRIEHPNAVGLLAVRGETGEAKVTAEDLLQASLRMRPDRIILGGLRGREAASFLRAVNSGHPGSITTLHADSPQGAVEQLSLMVLQAGLNLGRAEIGTYVRSVIDVFVQLSRTDGRRRVSQILFRRPAAEAAL